MSNLGFQQQQMPSIRLVRERSQTYAVPKQGKVSQLTVPEVRLGGCSPNVRGNPNAATYPQSEYWKHPNITEPSLEDFTDRTLVEHLSS